MSEAGPSILIVDDEVDFAESLSYWFEAEGYPVERAESGKEALERITKDPPDVVFLDINMTVMGGIETLKKLRETNKTLPVVMVTVAYQDTEKFMQSKELGISGFFQKSESLNQLGRVLEMVLKDIKAGSAGASKPTEGTS